MSRQSAHSHEYAGHTSPAPRYTAAHSNSSAFSASAGPNEDWTKTADLAERRRIQNRIAQRNYRKKLKRRLEDLEKRAASASPDPTEDEIDQYIAPRTGARRQQRVRTHSVPGPETTHRSQTPSFLQSQSMFSYDDEAAISQTTRQTSPTPSIFSHPSFSTADTTSYSSSYSLSPSYTSSAPTAMEIPMYSNIYLMPRTSTYLSSNDPAFVPISEEPYENGLGNFAVNSMPAAGMELTSSQAYHDARGQHTPTLSKSESLECFPCSREGSAVDLWALYPTPPASVTEDDPPFFSLPLDLALEDPDFLCSSVMKHDESYMSLSF